MYSVKQKLPTVTLKSIGLQSRVSDAYLTEKINDTRHVRSTIFSTHGNPYYKQLLIQKRYSKCTRETREISCVTVLVSHKMSLVSHETSLISREMSLVSHNTTLISHDMSLVSRDTSLISCKTVVTYI